MRAAHFMGRVNTTILLTLFYFTFLGVAKLVTVLLRKDLLDSQWKDRPSYWGVRKEGLLTDKASFLKPY